MRVWLSKNLQFICITVIIIVDWSLLAFLWSSWAGTRMDTFNVIQMGVVNFIPPIGGYAASRVQSREKNETQWILALEGTTLSMLLPTEVALFGWFVSKWETGMLWVVPATTCISLIAAIWAVNWINNHRKQ